MFPSFLEKNKQKKQKTSEILHELCAILVVSIMYTIRPHIRKKKNAVSDK